MNGPKLKDAAAAFLAADLPRLIHDLPVEVEFDAAGQAHLAAGHPDHPSITEPRKRGTIALEQLLGDAGCKSRSCGNWSTLGGPEVAVAARVMQAYAEVAPHLERVTVQHQIRRERFLRPFDLLVRKHGELELITEYRRVVSQRLDDHERELLRRLRSDEGRAALVERAIAHHIARSDAMSRVNAFTDAETTTSGVAIRRGGSTPFAESIDDLAALKQVAHTLEPRSLTQLETLSWEDLARHQAEHSTATNHELFTEVWQARLVTLIDDTSAQLTQVAERYRADDRRFLLAVQPVQRDEYAPIKPYEVLRAFARRPGDHVVVVPAAIADLFADRRGWSGQTIELGGPVSDIDLEGVNGLWEPDQPELPLGCLDKTLAAARRL